MMKRLVTALTALSISVGLLPVAYADTTTSGSDPEVTVVGKRIIDDDQYFEISLEVNGDYEDYSSVGVVIKYDPSLIVPTTWDEEATPVDMSASTSWATRRALPTLGKDTWTTHTALTYITQETDAGGTTTDVGYLYLGAEYPGILPNDSDANATPDPNATVAPTADPSATAEPTQTPAATLDPDADPHTNPVVVARFMYADENAKATIESKWTSAWDADWTQNTIMTVAPDDITSVSPAQFGFAYYKSDFSMKAFQFDYTDTILETTEQATTGDIEIVLGEGESAQSGGLSLNDIYVVLFYDWDDSLLGTFTCGVGEDSSADINEYIKTKFVHPQLQTQTQAQLTSTARTDNYRGEYPSIDPSTGTTFPDTIEQMDATSGETTTVDNPDAGTKYPLTNKLEYCFAGRDFNTDEDGNALPFVGGWTKVAAATMEDTWTALDSATNFKKLYDADGDEVFETDTDGNYIDADSNVIDMVSVDFANITEDDLENGTMSVKAVYTPGENLNLGLNNLTNNFYIAKDVKYELMTTAITESSNIYGISFQYERINEAGNGVTRAREPLVKMSITQENASGSTTMGVDIKNGEKIDVLLTPSHQVETVGYRLVTTYQSNVILGGEVSEENELGVFYKIDGLTNGFVFKTIWPILLKESYAYTKNGTAFSLINYHALNHLQLYRTAAGAKFTVAAQFNTYRARIKKCIQGVITDATTAKGSALTAEEEYEAVMNNTTYYQMQYALIKNAYLSAAEAETQCKSLYSWCQ